MAREDLKLLYDKCPRSTCLRNMLLLTYTYVKVSVASSQFSKFKKSLCKLLIIHNFMASVLNLRGVPLKAEMHEDSKKHELYFYFLKLQHV